jgi:hypothetical protein
MDMIHTVKGKKEKPASCFIAIQAAKGGLQKGAGFL